MALLHVEGFEGLYPDWAPTVMANNDTDDEYFNTIERYLQSHYSGLMQAGSARIGMARSWDGRGRALCVGNNSSSDDLFIVKALETAIPQGTAITIGVRIKFSNVSKNNEEILRIAGTASPFSAEARIRLTSNNALQLQYGSGTTVDTTANDVFEDNSWHYIEWQTVLSNTTSGSYEVRVDGVDVMSGTGVRTQQNSNTDAQCFHLRSVSGSNTDYEDVTLYDDWYILDGTGSVNNDFLGPVSIHHRQIKAVGSDNDFSYTGGGSIPESVNNIQIEESDATCMDTPNTSTNRQTLVPYQISGTSNTIYGVKITSRVKMEKGYEATKFKHVVDSDSSTGEDTQRTIFDHNGYLTKMGLFETDPATSALWTQNAFNSAEFGMEIE